MIKTTDTIIAIGSSTGGTEAVKEVLMALPPNTPDAIVDVYRKAFDQMSKDKEFLDQGEKISDGFVPMNDKDAMTIARTIADTSPEALEYSKSLMRKQGIKLD